MCCALVMWPEASISDSLVSLNAAGGPPSFKFVPGMMRGFGGGLQARRQKRRPGSDRLSHQSESDRTRSLLSQVRVRPDPIAPLTSPSQAGSDRPSHQSESGRIRSPDLEELEGEREKAFEGRGGKERLGKCGRETGRERQSE